MGTEISRIRDEVKAAGEDTRQDMEQRLQILDKMVHGRLDNQQRSIIAGERGDQEIHSGTLVEEHQQVNIVMEEKAAQKLEDAIDSFFSFDLIGGLVNVLRMGVDAVLGNTSMGEYESSNMFIVWNNNALIRCDAYYYRWNFSSTGVIDLTEGVVGILLIKRVIDIGKTDPQVLTWAVSRQASQLGKPSDAMNMIDEAIEVLTKVQTFQLALMEAKKKLKSEESNKEIS